MKITEICTLRLNPPPQERKTSQRRPSWWVESEVANPMF